MTVLVLWLCAAIASAVFGVMLYSVATFRSAPNVCAAGRKRSAIVEVIWALIPIAIVIVAIVPVVRALTA